MPQSHGTRRRPSGGGRRARSAPVPAPREAPEARGPGGPRGPYDGDRFDGMPPLPPEKKRRVRRVLTSNVTITVAAIAIIGTGVTLVDLDAFTGDDTKPPQAAAAGLSTNDMLAKLTSASDIDRVTANAVAQAKERAYKEHQAEMKRLKEKAKRDAAARAKLKAEQERERERKRLANSNPSAAQNKAYGKKMNALKGWGRCWPSLLTLWNHESGWNERAENPSSGAYGIPQALPGSKLASAGADWRTSSPTQIAWGLGYIKARYKDPCGAWSWWQAHNWY
ncbi:lytic transglycosylase domain-containing protein [Actinomadura bangladeshensis]|uniref:Lytic transglycosylase domain-containing protein n=1 Tax=Actinomadura bangladeshensis TaxID=453573 RepID=A0A4R4P0H7_9ACTN|nr:lytic transglycosylase domain-containing protein [Actinomadura bangladeshensis]TDC15711.1 lytic transglycosylase domain-containing protein [Actinomadura bangladeshensis]